MRAPCAAVPLPGGKPAPSGWMLMSQAAISAGPIAFPRFGPSAKAGLQTRASTSTTAKLSRSRVDMRDLPLAVDRPARDAVVVLARKGRGGRDRSRLAAVGHDLSPGRLDVAGLVPRARLQDRRTAIPAPRHTEPREGLAQHRLLQRRRRPALPAVRRDHDLRDPAVARIRDAGNLVEPRPAQLQPRLRMLDEGLHLLQEVELVGLAAWQDRRVSARLEVAHRRRRDEPD